MAKKNMVLAILLSFLWSGLGVIYAGNTNKGIKVVLLTILLELLMLYVTPIFGIGVFIVWIYSLLLTYNEVQLANTLNSPFDYKKKSNTKTKKESKNINLDTISSKSNTKHKNLINSGFEYNDGTPNFGDEEFMFLQGTGNLDDDYLLNYDNYDGYDY
jgi:hypothetical protein